MLSEHKCYVNVFWYTETQQNSSWCEMTIKPRAPTLSKDYNTMNTVLSPSSSCEQRWFPGQSLHLVTSSSLNPHHKCEPIIQWESLFCRLFLITTVKPQQYCILAFIFPSIRYQNFTEATVVIVHLLSCVRLLQPHQLVLYSITKKIFVDENFWHNF